MIVGPLRALLGIGYRIVQVGGGLLVLIAAYWVLFYVLPFAIAVIFSVAGFVLLVALFVGLFSPSVKDQR